MVKITEIKQSENGELSKKKNVVQRRQQSKDVVNYVVGERVEVRDKGAKWKSGVVTKGGSDPEVKPDEWESAYSGWDGVRRELKTATATASDPQEKKLEYAVDEKVYVSDDGDEWLSAVVTVGGTDPKIKPVGWETAYDGWKHIRKEKPMEEENAVYAIGDEVNVRDQGKEWQAGVVTKGGSDPYVRVDGWEESYNGWHEIRPLEEVTQLKVDDRISELDKEISKNEEICRTFPKKIKDCVWKADYSGAGTLQPQLDEAKVELEKLLKERRILVRKIRKEAVSKPKSEDKTVEKEEKVEKEEIKEPTAQGTDDKTHNKDGTLAEGCQVTVQIGDDVPRMATIAGPRIDGQYPLTLNDLADVSGIQCHPEECIVPLKTYKSLLHPFIQESFVPWWVSITDTKALAAILYPDFGVVPSDVICVIVDYCKSIPKWKALKLDEEEDTYERIKDRDAEPLGFILSWTTSLTKLHFSAGRILEAGSVSLGEGLKRNTTVTSLDMRQIQTIGTYGRKAIFQALMKSETIKTFSGINVSDLKNHDTDVKTSDLSGLHLGNVEAIIISEFLKRNTILTEINLLEHYFGFVGTKNLADALILNKTMKKVTLNTPLILDRFRDVIMKKVDVSNKRYNDWDGVIIANFLKINSVLKILKLENNEIGNYGARVFSESLIRNNTLEELSLQKNIIGSDGATWLAQALTKNKGLTKLFLGGNKIEDVGFKMMVKALTKNVTLTELMINECDIADAGCITLPDHFPNMHGLKILWLNNNKIDNKGAEYIGKGMKENSTLTTLILKGNTIASIGATSMANSLVSNKTLKLLDLGLNKIGKIGKKKLMINHYNNGVSYGDSFELQMKL